MANKSKKRRKDLRQEEDTRQQVNEQQDASVNLHDKSRGITTPSANMERDSERNSKGKERP